MSKRDLSETATTVAVDTDIYWLPEGVDIEPLGLGPKDEEVGHPVAEEFLMVMLLNLKSGAPI